MLNTAPRRARDAARLRHAPHRSARHSAGLGPVPSLALLAALALPVLLLGACTDYKPIPDQFKAATTTNADFTVREIVEGDLPSALDVDGTDINGVVYPDGSGFVNVAVANGLAHNVELLRIDGGLNVSSTTLPVGAEPTQVFFADLDGGSGQLDLVTYAANDRKLVLLTNSGGTWQTQTQTFTDIAHSIQGVRLRNTDSADSLLLTFPATGNLRVLHNDGAGGFAILTTFLCAGASAFQAGDFNAATDSNIDLAVLCYVDSTVRILLGDGTGGFTEQPVGGYALGAGPLSIVAADFDGNGRPDLAIANTLGSTVTILLGDGLGGFTASHIAVAANPEWLTIGRFDGVNASIAVNHHGLKELTVLLGNGAGGFTSVSVPVGEDPYALAVGDFSGSAAQDLFSLERVDRAASMLVSDGSGGFSRGVIGFQELPTRPRAVNFGGGGKDDLLLLQPSLDRLTILENRN